MLKALELDDEAHCFFSSRRRHTRSLRDWSSDVCSSDLERVADRCGDSGIRHGNNDVRVDRMFAREQATEHLAAFVDGAAKDNAVGPGEIDVLENALLERLLRREVDRLDAGFGDADHFAGFDFADILGVEEIERARFGGYQP